MGGKQSQDPMRGSYIIKCFQLDGLARYTSPIPVSWNNINVYNAISSACPAIMGRFSVTQNKDVGCSFNGDCIVWDLKFGSVYGELNQFEIISNEGDISNALGYSSDPLDGLEVTTNQE